MALQIERINFLRLKSNAAEIAAGITQQQDLGDLKIKFGTNYNTLVVTNSSTSPINIVLDGEEVAFLEGNNSVFSFDRDDTIFYTFLAIKNLSGADAIAANEIKFTIARTGAQLFAQEGVKE